MHSYLRIPNEITHKNVLFEHEHVAAKHDLKRILIAVFCSQQLPQDPFNFKVTNKIQSRLCYSSIKHRDRRTQCMP
jgi:hypothetical protein